MTLKQIAGLGRELVAFLRLFADCFGRSEPRELLRAYVKGQLSNLKRKNVEAIALWFRKAPRTLQRFLESIKWDEEKLRNRCQQIVAADHAHPQAIGTVDESAVAKSGRDTVGVQRQWCGNRGKIDNCVVMVHIAYAAPGFGCLLDSTAYLPKDWTNDPARRKKTTCRRRWSSRSSRRSRSVKSIGRWPTESASRRGRSTSCTAGTASSSMAWNRASRYSWPKCPPTSMAGCGSRKYCK
jgi:SRSO17 transposase